MIIANAMKSCFARVASKQYPKAMFSNRKIDPKMGIEIDE